MKTSILAVLAAVMVAIPATTLAADLTLDVPDETVVTTDAFDWEGFYVGGFVGYHVEPLIGGEFGYNFLASERLLAGINASGHIDAAGDTEVWVDGRLGGVWDNVALYGSGGVGLYNLATPLWRVGVGVEVAITDTLTLNGQVGLDETIGAVPSIPYAQVGLRFHF